MAGDEPRRSVRATKGQHKKLEGSAEPTPKPKKGAKGKASKKTVEPEEEEEESEDVIRCVCGNTNDDIPGRKFVACDSCEVWQHNDCMGVPLQDNQQPEHYFCEQCHPEDHEELLQAMERGERLWEERQAAVEKNKKKGKGKKGARQSRVSGVKAEEPEAPQTSSPAPATSQESGTKRKFEEEAPPAEPSLPSEQIQEPMRASSGRADKKRKSSAKAEAVVDPDTALVDIDQLPKDRQNVATALSKLITEGIRDRSKSGQYRIPDGDTADSRGKRLASLIEYEMHMVHSSPGKSGAYTAQFRSIHPNLKRNAVLLDRVIYGSLSPTELATMSSQDMQSEEKQREDAELKEKNDKQAVMIQEEEKPRVRRTHKGDEYVDESERHGQESVFTAQPVRRRESQGEGDTVDGTGAPPVERRPSNAASVRKPSDAPAVVDTSPANRRTSSQQFDINNVWSKTQQSPNAEHAPSRLLQYPPRRQSSAPKHEQRTEDADVDRLLADDNDDTYSPADISSSDSSIVWRGKLIQPGVAELTVTGRFIAGNDFSRYVPWAQFLPSMLEIDGRLDSRKADDYLCGLQWSKKSDVSVIALTPYDNRDAFDAIFEYFATRNRYAVGKKGHGISELVKDLYVSPVEVNTLPPPHIPLLDHCGIDFPNSERMLLATYVVNKPASWDTASTETSLPPDTATMPPHLRQSLSGPGASPISSQPGPAFSPRGGFTPDQANGHTYSGGGQTFNHTPLPPNPYGPQPGPTAYPHPGQGMPPAFGQPTFTPTDEMRIVLGHYVTAPVVAQLATAAGGVLSTDILRNTRDIFESDPTKRTLEDMNMFAQQLAAKGQ